MSLYRNIIAEIDTNCQQKFPLNRHSRKDVTGCQSFSKYSILYCLTFADLSKRPQNLRRTCHLKKSLNQAKMRLLF